VHAPIRPAGGTQDRGSRFARRKVEQISEIGALERLVSNDLSNDRAARKLALLKTRIEGAYYDKVLRRLR
jgi:hypothetical protein